MVVSRILRPILCQGQRVHQTGDGPLATIPIIGDSLKVTGRRPPDACRQVGAGYHLGDRGHENVTRL